ncbi:hypothetical protein LCGC14_0598860 [marine sediment metagenome]|uniref:Uncharacterized protein n=1 Tax=marine sediment metagenome TaxID=412755 RepID=A0A0F9UJP4_9ZZZZ
MKTLTPRERILKERGLLEKQSAPRKHKRLQPAIRVTVLDRLKTPLMRYLEQKYGKLIEDVLVSGSLSVVAHKLGDEVDTSTLSKWIKRFKLRYSKDNLPSCMDCKQYGLACGQGVCYVLLGLELWELVPIKQKEVLNEGDKNPNPTT